MSDELMDIERRAANTNPDTATPAEVRALLGDFRRVLAHAYAVTGHLSNLLAVIHRDGGHYEAEHGTEKACADAEVLVVARLDAEARAVAAEALSDRSAQAAVDATRELAHVTAAAVTRADAAEAAIAEYIAADEACAGQPADDYSDAVRLVDARKALVDLLPEKIR